MTNLSPKKKVRAIYASDIHIGSKHSQCHKFLEFLYGYEYEELHLVGDIFDGYEMANRIHWTPEYNIFIRELIHAARRCKIYFYIGNHDSFLGSFVGTEFCNFIIIDKNKVSFLGKNTLILHGHQLENDFSIGPRMYKVGSFFYRKILCVSSYLRAMGIKSNFAKYVKNKLKKCINYITDYEHRAIKMAAEQKCQRVITGHIHSPVQYSKDGVEYINCGDWVENCSAVVEDLSGNFDIVYYD